MTVPAQNRNLNELHPIMRERFEDWRADVGKLGKFLQPYETFRTEARQFYLYSLGRTVQNPNGGPGQFGSVVTYTVDSLHRYRSAVDLMPVVGGVASFGERGYAELYAARDLAVYGLETLSFERPHVQILGGQAACARLGIKRDAPGGSVWPKVKPAPASVVVPAPKPVMAERPKLVLTDLAGRDVEYLGAVATYGGLTIERRPGYIHVTRDK